MTAPSSLTRYIGLDAIKTPRLIIRPFRMPDADMMYRNWAGDPDVTRFMSWKPYADADETHSVISEWLEGYAKQETLNWAIVLKEIDEPIGSIGLRSENKPGVFEMGYCIGKKWWRQGIVAEAAKALLNHAFENGAIRISAHHNPANPNSGRVMQKIGMTYEGTLRMFGYTNAWGYYDDVIYAMTLDDWEESKHAN